MITRFHPSVPLAWLRFTLVAVAVITVTSCDVDPATPGGGDESAFDLVLTSPAGVAGALLLDIEAEPETITAIESPHALFSRTRADGVWRVAVVGDLADGTVLTIRTRREILSADLVVLLRQVSDRSNRLLWRTGYRLAVVPRE